MTESHEQPGLSEAKDTQHFVRLTDAAKTHRTVAGTTVEALRNVNLSVRQGEFLTIIGPSGSGKSTLIQLIAGIEKPSAGSVALGNGQDAVKIGYVFQQNTVFPWRTVEANLSYPLELEGKSKSLRHEEATRICELVGLKPDVFLKKYPRELSGGEVRRVAIGMSLAHGSNLLIMDEPTSQLDFVTRFSMQQIVQELWLLKKFTIIYVTHDVEEAILLGDRLLIMQAGALKSSTPIDLPRPRTKATLADPRFIQLQSEVLAICEGQ